MKILLVSPTPPPNGGIASWTEKYIDFFKNSDFQIELIDTSIIGQRIRCLSKKNYLDEIIRLIQIIKNLNCALKKNEFNIAHINTSCSKMGMIKDWLIIKKIYKYNLPIILQCHCDVKDQIQQNMLSKYLFGKICKFSSKILVLNEKSHEYLKELKIKSSIFPNFIDDEIVKNEKKTINEKIHNILFIGHITKTKGIDELLEVAKCLKDINFIFVGELHENYKNKSYAQNIFFVGNVNHREVIGYLDNADVFILPSYTEGFSVAVLEAMARGLPIITTNVGYNTTLIGDEGGIIVETRDVNSIIESISILQNYRYREKISTRNIKVASEYTQSCVINKLLNIYMEVINECIPFYKK